MIGFLIKRPIAVSMVFIAMLLLGVVASLNLPVSLLPDADIPRLGIRVYAPQYFARDLENSIMAPLRNYVMQVNGIRDMKTDARNGFGAVTLVFDRGINIDLAFMEINEQVDKAMVVLPDDISRPVVVKASASDIPILFLDILLKEEYIRNQTKADGTTEEKLFLELSTFSDEVLRRRFEQLPEVAMADLSGREYAEIIISPKMNKLMTLNMQLETIEEAIRASHGRPEAIMLQDKQFQYHVRLANNLLDARDIGGIYLKHGGRLWQLSDLCSIEVQLQPPDGKILFGKRRAISIAIIKQSEARMQDLQKVLKETILDLENDYPYLEFIISRDQTQLLDNALLSLRQTLLAGAMLAFLVMALFVRDKRAPWLIIISVPSAAIISMLFFYLANISINVISVSGLILCIGMMIDNSIIVIDNINRHREHGKNLHDACKEGTNEVIKPLLCSVLTSCSVFIPLVMNSGLAGALFHNQAIAVSIGLFVSFIMAICVVPVFYHLLYKSKKRDNQRGAGSSGMMGYKKLYIAGFFLSMRNQKAVWGIAASLVAALFLFFLLIEKEVMPDMQRNDMLLHVDWNENIHASENARRVRKMLDMLEIKPTYSNSMIGRQQFLLAANHKNDQQQATLYLKAKTPAELELLQDDLLEYFRILYPDAIHHFEKETGLFDYVFGSNEPPLELRLLPTETPHNLNQLQKTLRQLAADEPMLSIGTVSLQQSLLLKADLPALAMYDVDYHVLAQTIRNLSGNKRLITLTDGHALVPVKTATGNKTLDEIVAEGDVLSSNGVKVPLRYLLQLKDGYELQSIIAGMEGEYFPIEIDVNHRHLNHVKGSIQESLEKAGGYKISFHGMLISRQTLVQQLAFTACIAIVLLFLILAAQFESLKLPFIVLLELPIATSGALLIQCLLGVSLNVMSMIGMVVMAGIIINDSILKIDTINRLRDCGTPLLKAMITAGHYRLKAILMTSMTTICALMPFLFIEGMGGELQKPLAAAVIGGLGFGTLVSLFFIPVSYYCMQKNN